MGRLIRSSLGLACVVGTLVGLAPAAAQAAGVATEASYFGICDGFAALGDGNVGDPAASIAFNEGFDGASGDVWGIGTASGVPNLSSVTGTLKYEGTGPLAGNCNLDVGVISTQQYSVRNLSDPTATSAEIDIVYQIEGSFQSSTGDFSFSDAFFGIDLYRAIDPGNPLNGPREALGNARCGTGTVAAIECSNFVLDLSDIQTQFLSDGFGFTGSVSGRFTIPILGGPPLVLGVTTASGVSLDEGADPVFEISTDFGDTFSWQVSAVDPNVEIVPVPEPGTGALLGASLVGLAGARRRRA